MKFLLAGDVNGNFDVLEKRVKKLNQSKTLLSTNHSIHQFGIKLHSLAKPILDFTQFFPRCNV